MRQTVQRRQTPTTVSRPTRPPASTTCAGLEIKVEGFSHKLGLLTRRIFSAVASPRALAAAPADGAGAGAGPSGGGSSFAVVKEALVRKYRNSNMQARNLYGL